MQLCLVLNLAEVHTFPGTLRRATEPTPPTFLLPSDPQEKEDEKNSRRMHQRENCFSTSANWEPYRSVRLKGCLPRYCHDNYMAHRDIKANNVLINSRGNTKLCDFALAVKVVPGKKLKDFCGTLAICAPELQECLPPCAASLGGSTLPTYPTCAVLWLIPS